MTSDKTATASQVHATTACANSQPMCPLCKTRHFINVYSIFVSKNPSQRDIIKQHKHCFNYLSAMHSAQECRNKYAVFAIRSIILCFILIRILTRVHRELRLLVARRLNHPVQNRKSVRCSRRQRESDPRSLSDSLNHGAHYVRSSELCSIGAPRRSFRKT